MRLASGRGTIAVAVAVTLACASAAPSAIASTALVARGRTGAFPWRLRVTSKTIQARPTICVSFLWALGPGQPIGNGFPTCVTAAKAHNTSNGLVWSFDLHVGIGGFDGVIPETSAGASGSSGLRAVILLVDPRASRAVATLGDREVLRMRTQALPRTLHRRARIAWAIQNVGLARTTGSAIDIRHAVAYDKHGHVVGSYRPPRRR
jgi:hypothetical protein